MITSKELMERMKDPNVRDAVGPANDCTTCRGSGWVGHGQGGDTCGTCEGSGRARDKAPAVVVPQPFGLSTEEIETLRSNGLKPEEIAGDQRVQAQRVGELLHWFVRLARDSANPKWTRSHAFELAYYLATTDDRAPFDIDAVERAAWLQGLQEPPEAREMAIRHGWIPAIRAEERSLVDQLTGALRFILAFYEPGQRYLDTEAWKHAEAGGRRALAAGEAALANTREQKEPT